MDYVSPPPQDNTMERHYTKIHPTISKFPNTEFTAQQNFLLEYTKVI